MNKQSPCACAISLLEVADELSCVPESVIRLARRERIAVVENWKGSPALSTADAGRLVRVVRAEQKKAAAEQAARTAAQLDREAMMRPKAPIMDNEYLQRVAEAEAARRREALKGA